MDQYTRLLERAQACSDNPALKEQWLDKYASFISFHPELLEEYQAQLPAGKDQFLLTLFDRALSNTHNASTLRIWRAYINFVKSLSSRTDLEARRRQGLERGAIQAAIFESDSAEFWEEFMEFSVARRNFLEASLVGFTAIALPLRNMDIIQSKYFDILDSFFEQIFEQATREGNSGRIPLALYPQINEHLRVITEVAGGDCESFKQYLRSQVVPISMQELEEFEAGERVLEGCRNHNEELIAWMKLINMEKKKGNLKKANFLFEKAQGSKHELDCNLDLFRSQVEMIHYDMKDAGMVRAKIDRKLLNSSMMNPQTKIDLLLLQAYFEELNNNPTRARTLYLSIDKSIAPGLLKATMAFANFEKRQGNWQRAKAIYEQKFNLALKQQEKHAVAFLAAVNAHFLAGKFHDEHKALDKFKQAVQNKDVLSHRLFSELLLFYKSKLAHNFTAKHEVSEMFFLLIDHVSDLMKDGGADGSQVEELVLALREYLVHFREELPGSSKDLAMFKSRLASKGLLKNPKVEEILGSDCLHFEALDALGNEAEETEVSGIGECLKRQSEEPPFGDVAGQDIAAGSQAEEEDAVMEALVHSNE